MNNTLDITDSNHLKLKCNQLTFEILGGINPENYHSLRVMLVASHNRKRHRDNVDLFSQDQLQVYKKNVCEKTGVHRDAVTIDFETLITQLEEYKLDLQQNKNKPENKTIQLSDEQRKQAIELLQKPKLLATINEMIGNAGIIGNNTNRIILFLTYLTRKTKTSLHAVIQSKYNDLQSKLADVIPEEEQITISHISENALFYFNEEELQNKVVFVEDTISNRKSIAPLIGFQKSNVITKTTVKKNEYAELVTVQKHVKGNVSLSISTRAEGAFTKNGLLSFVLSEDTGKEQEEQEMLHQKKQSAGLVSEYTEKKVAEQIKNIQRVLSPIRVINPFAMELELPEQIRNKQITNLHYLRFIETITFLKQYQRPQKVNEDTGELYIETTIEDIKEANALLTEILLNRSDKISKTSRTYLEQLKRHVATSKQNNEPFTLLEISVALHIPKSTLKRYMQRWVDTGLVKAIQNKGQTQQYELANINEYKELQASIAKSMDTGIANMVGKSKIKKTTEPKPQPSQNKNGAVKELKINPNDEPNHTRVGVG